MQGRSATGHARRVGSANEGCKASLEFDDTRTEAEIGGFENIGDHSELVVRQIGARHSDVSHDSLSLVYASPGTWVPSPQT